MNNYAAQKIRTCIATYINLYRVMPGIQEMVDWTGESYETVLSVYKVEAAAQNSMAA